MQRYPSVHNTSIAYDLNTWSPIKESFEAAEAAFPHGSNAFQRKNIISELNQDMSEMTVEQQAEIVQKGYAKIDEFDIEVK